ncbi:SPOR domain-containing protein [Novilysobacter antarcticus]|uniref:SPOR domain-containing protein n=1 Tax=Novilysobacter antarcticus TaxID=2862543 RepID=UPI001C98FEB5|nr:SPOR domain-containing protein [Lysobacter antarcticus]
MLIRALVLLLLVLNLGVALWGALAPGPAPPATLLDIPPGVERLQLLPDLAEPIAPSPARGPTIAVKIVHCASFGPYDTADAASTAGKGLQVADPVDGEAAVDVVKTAIRTEPGSAPRSWRVLLPPLPSAAQADIVVKRIVATGFKDYYVIREGKDANAIALGLFRNEQAAQSRAETLQKAGFDAAVEPVGAGPEQHWLDLGADAPFKAEAVRRQLGAARTKPLDCESLAASVEPAPADLRNNPAAR